MLPSPLRCAVVADLSVPKVNDGWRRFEPIIRGSDGLEVAAVFDGVSDYRCTADVEAVIVLGGDGAMLRACRNMNREQRPLLGVNLGRLGFLTDLSIEEFPKHIESLRLRNFQVVQHLMFECGLHRADGTTQWFLGLNEAVVSSAGALRMIEVRLIIDGEAVTNYHGDGLIISTPVGSTAHSLSAGGPILRQDLQVFVVTPICPHTLTNRPLVDSASRVFRLEVPAIPEGPCLVIDGQVRLPLASGDAVEVRRAPVTFGLIKVPGSSYFQTLHRKLGWGGAPNYRPQ